METGAARLRNFAVIALVPLFFASNVVIGRFVAGDVAPWTLAFLRWLGAFLILLPFAVPGVRASLAAIKAEWRIIALLGFLGMLICGGVVYLALHHTTAANGTLIYSAANVMILLLEWRFRGRPIGIREMIGTALAFGGVAVVAVGSAGGHFVLNPGDLLFGLAAFAWAIYSVLLKRPGVSAIPGSALFVSIMLAGIVLLAPLMLWEVASGPAFPHNARGWLAVAAVALIPSVGAYSGYQYGVRRFGPAPMAMSSYLWTPYGLILSVVFLGEALHLSQLFGLVLIVPGVFLATARLPSRRPPGAAAVS
jgi:drug/metabolite transporter (DMT)-like permease